MKTKTNVKAGADVDKKRSLHILTFQSQHNQASAALKVRSNVKAAGPILQHNQTSSALKVRSNVKAAGPGLVIQHNQTSALRVKANVKAGGPPLVLQHNQATSKKARRAKGK